MPDQLQMWKRLLQNAHAKGLSVQIFCHGHQFKGKVVDLHPDGSAYLNNDQSGHFHFEPRAALQDRMRLELA